MTSEHLDADRLLRMLPSAAWLEIRALLLERFGRHNEILRSALCCIFTAGKRSRGHACVVWQSCSAPSLVRTSRMTANLLLCGVCRAFESSSALGSRSPHGNTMEATVVGVVVA